MTGPHEPAGPAAGAHDVLALAHVIAASRRIVAFTGAGISTESGIPDFRGPSGLWKTLDPSRFTVQSYLSDPDHRRLVWRRRLETWSKRYQPNAAHHALVKLERAGLLDCVITQNVDGLHQAAGSSLVLELHGNALVVRCLDCRREWPTSEVLERVRGGDDDPHCIACGGLLKSGTISFGEAMPADVTVEAFRRAEACDLCLVVGSSLTVQPAAGVPVAAARAGARLAIVNAEPTPLDETADVVTRGRAGDVVPAAVALASALAG